MKGLLDVVDPSLSRAWHVPPRNERFAGRIDFLADLHARFQREALFDHTQVLQGVAGIGKTQIALEYAHRHRNEYDVTWWLRAGDEQTLDQDLGKLAVALGLASPDAGPRAVRSTVRATLAARDKWLLILDGLPRPADLMGLLPRTAGGRVIVTSRAADWRDVAPTMPVGPFARDESIFFLRSRAGKTDSMIAVSQLANTLGDHPLALEQAATVVERTGIKFEQYLRRLEACWADLLRRGRPSQNYPEVIAMSWEVLSRQLHDVSRMAADLVNLCAYFGDEPIPQSLLASGADCVTEPLAGTLRDAPRLQETLTILSQYAVIDRAEGAARVHPLVRSLARDRLAPQERKNWSLMALNTAAAAFVFDVTDLRTWPACDAILPHALAAAEHATEMGIGVDSAAGLLNQAGHCLYRRAQYYRAKDVLDRALVLGYQVYGESNPRLSAIANNLARVLTKLGDVAEARQRFEWALALDEKAYGPAHPHVAEILNNLGVALIKCDEPDIARQRFERALDISKANYGVQHASVASILNNLGYVLMITGDLPHAAEKFASALTMCESTLGPAHPEVAAVLNNLGDLARSRKDFAAAEAHYERALAIVRVAYGPNHPDVARDLGDLGRLMLDTNRAAEARLHFERALTIDESTYGPNHAAVASRLEELSRALKALDDVDGAVRCMERVRKIERVRDMKIAVPKAPTVGLMKSE